MSRLHNMKHERDPKEVIWEAVGEVPENVVTGIKLLVATYERPEQTKGGLILTSKTRDEDQWQGKCGLVVAIGPLAFHDTPKWKFGGYKAKVGEWVWYSPHNGKQFQLNNGSTDGKHCRVLDDFEIEGTLPHPDFIL